ncbi:ethanolamine ammonia-lyase reactivating factor EutA [Paenibacillus sp. CF384]|uniref:ethanolamine ammonia-lyase reactivating factor EutA n=1 Tax=Paenibacillus sp. CF384 TaxID=1884382 RepID=UPI00089A1BD8|nr:ethanolamine ammonia-lyase reactivating factor EutA [Paenibacillus sp. CF384]SDX08734.1 ethanolamine utilization protein EutA [Paenibacillus sp. CF384]
MEEQWITSVGIDIGTSTTKMIVSRLRLKRTSSAVSIPRYEIVERQLVYASPMYTTPLIGRDELHADGVWEIIMAEYQRAGIRPAELKTGAVIITGETANKRNAREIVQRLAERSGDFVVAAAGADLEGLLAGRGAGADMRSMHVKGAVANLDIGGGTANVVIFRRGQPIKTVTFHVGGRLIELDTMGRVTAVSPSIRPWLTSRGYWIDQGQLISFEALAGICQDMSRCMLDYVAGGDLPREEYDPALRELLVDVGGKGAGGNGQPLIEEWMVSGGIGLLMELPKPTTMAEVAAYGDIGPLLAHEIKDAMALHYDIAMGKPNQTVRATVIGAGMQSTEISGATIYLDALSTLPIRNLPVYRLDELTDVIFANQDALTDRVTGSMRVCAGLYDKEASIPFALAVRGMKGISYSSVQRLAAAICRGYLDYFAQAEVLVVVCEHDMAQALGQSLRKLLEKRLSIICIDQITVMHGDYIDLGEPLPGMLLPVMIKTLVFQPAPELDGSEGG